MKTTLHLMGIVLVLTCLSVTSALADIQFQGSTTGEFVPLERPLTFQGVPFIVTVPVGGFRDFNVGTFEIQKKDVSCSGINCYVENWDTTQESFTLTFTFGVPTVAGPEEFIADIDGTIRKAGNSSNYKVSDVTFDFDTEPLTLKYTNADGEGSFRLSVFDPAAMNITLNGPHADVTSAVTARISEVTFAPAVSNDTFAPVPEPGILAIFTVFGAVLVLAQSSLGRQLKI